MTVSLPVIKNAVREEPGLIFTVQGASADGVSVSVVNRGSKTWVVHPYFTLRFMDFNTFSLIEGTPEVWLSIAEPERELVIEPEKSRLFHLAYIAEQKPERVPRVETKIAYCRLTAQTNEITARRSEPQNLSVFCGYIDAFLEKINELVEASAQKKN